MTTPWQCPACKTWIAPDVREHRCDDPPAIAEHVAPTPVILPPTYILAPGWARCPACGTLYMGGHFCWTYYPQVTCGGTSSSIGTPFTGTVMVSGVVTQPTQWVT